MAKYFILILISLFVSLVASAAEERCPAPAVNLNTAIPMTLGQMRAFRAAINLKEMMLEKSMLSAAEKTTLQNAIKYLKEEYSQFQERLLQLSKAARKNNWCGDAQSGGPAIDKYIRELRAQVLAKDFQPMSQDSYMKNVKKHFLKNGDKNVYGVFKGIYSGIKEAGLEIINVTVDAQSTVLFGIFDPQAGQYYEFRSGLAKSIETNGVEKTVKAIPRGVYDSVVTEGLSGDPEKTGKAYANFMMMVMGTEAAASQAVNTMGRMSNAANAVKLSVPTLDFVPTLDGALTLAPAVAQVNITPVVSAVAATGHAGATSGVVCSVIAGSEMNGGTPSGSSPNISAKYLKDDPPADVSPEGLKSLTDEIKAKVNALPEEEFTKQLQGWLDDMNTSVDGSKSRKGYTPGATKDTSIKTVSQLEEGMKSGYGKSTVQSSGEFSKLTGSAPMNIYGQISMPIEPTMASMMLKMKPQNWATYKDYAVGAAMLERLMRNFQSKKL